MVVYVIKASEARQLLNGQYFHIAGEYAYTGVSKDLPDVLTVKNWATKLTRTPNYRCVGDVPSQDIVGARQSSRNVFRVADRTSRVTVPVVSSTRRRMHRTLKINQLNVRKQRSVQQSVMNDDELHDFAVLALSEPYSFREGY